MNQLVNNVKQILNSVLQADQLFLSWLLNRSLVILTHSFFFLKTYTLFTSSSGLNIICSYDLAFKMVKL